MSYLPYLDKICNTFFIQQKKLKILATLSLNSQLYIFCEIRLKKPTVKTT